MKAYLLCAGDRGGQRSPHGARGLRDLGGDLPSVSFRPGGIFSTVQTVGFGAAARTEASAWCSLLVSCYFKG